MTKTYRQEKQKMPCDFPSKEKAPYAIKGRCAIMGTFVTIVVIDTDQRLAREAMGLAFKEFFKVNNLMSVYRKESEISRLNNNGYFNNMSSDTLHVIQRAIFFSELTDGAFDITILPVLQYWEERKKKNRMPVEEELRGRLNQVDYRKIEITGRNIHFLKKDMGITLAGVAKGYAVDKAIETLSRNGIRHALVNGGGDIRVIGGKADGLAWKIGIRDPRDRGKIYTTVDLYDQAIASSGTYHRSFNDLIDPLGGRPARDIISSSIITEKAMDADALATSSLIMGSEKGARLLNGFENSQAFFITEDGRLIKNPEV